MIELQKCPLQWFTCGGIQKDKRPADTGFLKFWRTGKLSRTKDHLANSTQAGEPAEARMGKPKRKVEHCMLATQGVRFEGPGNLPRNKLVKVGSKRFLVW